MHDPAPDTSPSAPTEQRRRRGNADSTAWRRPQGVAPGTWRYVHEGAIAARYDDFVAATPLCRVDLAMLAAVFPDVSRSSPNDEGLASGRNSVTGDSSPTAESSQQKKWLLDLGCGTGRASEVLSRHGYGVLAVDLSLPMLQQANARQLPAVNAIQANLVELGCFADSVAEGAVCLFSTLGMIQGRKNRRQFLAHVRRIVRPGGAFFLHVHHRYAALTNLPGCRQLASTAIRSVIRKDWEFGDAVYAYRGLPDMFLHQFSRRELIADFDASGWRVARWDRLSLDGSQIVNDGWKIPGGFLIVLSPMR